MINDIENIPDLYSLGDCHAFLKIQWIQGIPYTKRYYFIPNEDLGAILEWINLYRLSNPTVPCSCNNIGCTKHLRKPNIWTWFDEVEPELEYVERPYTDETMKISLFYKN